MAGELPAGFGLISIPAFEAGGGQLLKLAPPQCPTGQEWIQPQCFTTPCPGKCAPIIAPDYSFNVTTNRPEMTVPELVFTPQGNPASSSLAVSSVASSSTATKPSEGWALIGGLAFLAWFLFRK